jgi:hypothetical protein
MDELLAHQDKMPDHKAVLAKLSREQLTATFQIARAKVLSTEKGFLAHDFEKVCPRSYSYYDINGKPQHERHPLVKYMCTLVDDSELKFTKEALIEIIDQALRGFMYILDEDPFSPEDREGYKDTDDKEFVTLTVFEAYLRKCAISMFVTFDDMTEQVAAKRDAVSDERRKLRNLKQQVKRAEQRVAYETERIALIKSEQTAAMTKLSQLKNQ